MDELAKLLIPEYEKLDYVRLLNTGFGWVMADYDPVAQMHYFEDIYDELGLVTLLLVEQEAQRREKIHMDVDLEECEKEAREKAPEILEYWKKQII